MECKITRLACGVVYAPLLKRQLLIVEGTT